MGGFTPCAASYSPYSPMVSYPKCLSWALKLPMPLPTSHSSPIPCHMPSFWLVNAPAKVKQSCWIIFICIKVNHPLKLFMPQYPILLSEVLFDWATQGKFVHKMFISCYLDVLYGKYETQNIYFKYFQGKFHSTSYFIENKYKIINRGKCLRFIKRTVLVNLTM